MERSVPKFPGNFRSRVVSCNLVKKRSGNFGAKNAVNSRQISPAPKFPGKWAGRHERKISGKFWDGLLGGGGHKKEDRL